MKIGPKYKIARRLGAAVFEKTQSPKFALSEQKRKKTFTKSRSNYGAQLIEKQKVRFTYSITEGQLANYVKKAIAASTKNQTEVVYQSLETRLDAIILRAGFAKTRRQARQMVSHGHVKINGVRNTVPSTHVTKDMNIEVKESSKSKGLFTDFDERFKDVIVPAWLKVDAAKKSVALISEPVYSPKESHFDLQAVLQFYKR
jgi:small subunit ribosomal protein S4